jgi:hypothetical protein
LLLAAGPPWFLTNQQKLKGTENWGDPWGPVSDRVDIQNSHYPKVISKIFVILFISFYV